MMNKKGFTLVELMVVIVIIGVLAAVAIPKFSAATNKAKTSEFPTILSTIVSGEKTFNAEMDRYVACTQVQLADTLGIDLAPKYFGYKVVAISDIGTDFQAQADVSLSYGDAVAATDWAAVTDGGAKNGTAVILKYARSYFGGSENASVTQR
jgi:prepilin-type N-terminal cleavage/methylation domain-containing protein